MSCDEKMNNKRKEREEEKREEKGGEEGGMKQRKRGPKFKEWQELAPTTKKRKIKEKGDELQRWYEKLGEKWMDQEGGKLRVRVDWEKDGDCVSREID